MITPLQEQKAFHILKLLRQESFTLGELQSRVFIDRPWKHGHDRTDKAGRRHYAPITIQSFRMSGSGLPAPILSKFRTREWTPHEKSIKRLSAFYDRYHYNMMRSKGVNTRDARNLSRLPPDQTSRVLRDYQAYAQRIAGNYLHNREHDPVPVYCIQWGMAHSGHGVNDWQMISKFSGLPKKRASIKKRTSKYEH